MMPLTKQRSTVDVLSGDWRNVSPNGDGQRVRGQDSRINWRDSKEWVDERILWLPLERRAVRRWYCKLYVRDVSYENVGLFFYECIYTYVANVGIV